MIASLLIIKISVHVIDECEKRRAYDECVREVERAYFSPLVFAATGGMGPTAITLFRKLASMLAEKRSINYRKCLFWLRCSLCFSLLRISVMCFSNRSPSTSNIDLLRGSLGVALFDC